MAYGKMSRAMAEDLLKDAREQVRLAQETCQHAWAESKQKQVDSLLEYIRYRAPSAPLSEPPAAPAPDWHLGPTTETDR